MKILTMRLNLPTESTWKSNLISEQVFLPDLTLPLIFTNLAIPERKKYKEY